MARTTLPVLVLLMLVAAACNDHKPVPELLPPANPLVLAAGMEAIEPSGVDPAYQIDLERLGITRVDTVYRLTTPADKSFSFDVLTRAEGNEGWARVSVAHVADNKALPSGAPDSLALVGCVPTGTGIIGRLPWLDAYGDGFARMTLGGAVQRDQLLAFETESATGRSVARARCWGTRRPRSR